MLCAVKRGVFYHISYCQLENRPEDLHDLEALVIKRQLYGVQVALPKDKLPVLMESMLAILELDPLDLSSLVLGFGGSLHGVPPLHYPVREYH